MHRVSPGQYRQLVVRPHAYTGSCGRGYDAADEEKGGPGVPHSDWQRSRDTTRAPPGPDSCPNQTPFSQGAGDTDGEIRPPCQQSKKFGVVPRAPAVVQAGDSNPECGPGRCPLQRLQDQWKVYLDEMQRRAIRLQITTGNSSLSRMLTDRHEGTLCDCRR